MNTYEYSICNLFKFIKHKTQFKILLEKLGLKLLYFLFKTFKTFKYNKAIN